MIRAAVAVLQDAATPDGAAFTDGPLDRALWRDGLIEVVHAGRNDARAHITALGRHALQAWGQGGVE